MAKVAAEAEELPKAIVRRVVKEKLSQLSGDKADMILHQEAQLAFSESSRIFIHYLSATANDICKESRRTTINAEDVLKALDEIEFSEYVDPLKAALDEFRKKNAEKRAGSTSTKEVKRRRKTDQETSVENGDVGEKDFEDDREDEKEEEGNSDSHSHDD
ncbi:DNA polymerase II subunit B4 [Ancistrocladus abbreviatus]